MGEIIDVRTEFWAEVHGFGFICIRLGFTELCSDVSPALFLGNELCDLNEVDCCKHFET